jgi:hypothetical protein
MFLEADADEVDNVGVVELAHDESLHQEVHLSLKATSQASCSQNFLQKITIILRYSYVNLTDLLRIILQKIL